ncbi:MAG: hypothetical protein J6D79_01590 [Clostridia bacterium]|nr:hypothetical protein [Clostridia bacterium]
MKTLFLLLFAAVSAVHLAASFVSNKKLRAATKGFILLFLLLYYLFAAEKRNSVLIAAVATSWLGDVLLIPPGNGWFAAGGISFMLSHFCFIAVYIMAVNFADVNVLLTVLAFLVYCVLIFLVFRALRETTPKKLYGGMIFYLFCNAAMNVFAFMLLVSRPCAATALTYIGAVSFFASDSLLFLTKFYKKPMWRGHFPVMLTYIIAEFLITQGILMLG